MDSSEVGTQRRLTGIRRYVWWSLGAAPLMAVLPTSVILVVQDIGVVRVVIGWLALAVLLTESVRLLRAAMRADTVPWWEPVTVGVLMLVVYAEFAPRSQAGEYWALLPATLLGIGVLLIPSSRRWTTFLAGMTLIAATGATTVSLSGEQYVTVRSAIVLALVASLFMVFFTVSSEFLWRTVLELDRQRRTAADLAVAEERLRFAADLHDIQGNHLQAIALKGELTERLIGQDDDAARTQAAEIAELARTALSDTRAVVQNYRTTSLDTELANAVGILGAAGITVTVDGAADDIPVSVQPLFGALVREGTTNLLRHSKAGTASLRMAVTGGRITAMLANDGIADAALSEGDGSGIAGLRERFAAAGGTVEVGTRDGRFELTASIPEWSGS